jgi:hypothetical protein
MRGQEFRTACERLGLLTTAQKAEAFAVTERSIQHWESGDRRVPGPARIVLRLRTELIEAQARLAVVQAALAARADSKSGRE